MKTFYRVCSIDSLQGLWYDFDGNFTGLIHDKFNFCANHELRMDFDPELVGWLSAVEELEHLWQWFSKDDVKKLQEHGYYIYQFEASQHKFYERFQHLVIKQELSIPTQKIILL